MTVKINNKNHTFSFIESLTSEGRDPYQDEHFQNVLDDIKALELWMKKNQIQNGWNLPEKLAFLRNVESTVRTGAAVRRTQLAWFALSIGSIAAVVGLFIAIV